MSERYDRVEGYCRKLGHHVAFGYCRRVEQGLPCALVRDCWFTRLPIQEFLEAHYSAAELERQAASSPGKLASILQIVKKVQGGA